MTDTLTVTEADKQRTYALARQGFLTGTRAFAGIDMEFARHREQAVQSIIDWLRTDEGKGSDFGADCADGFADFIEKRFLACAALSSAMGEG